MINTVVTKFNSQVPDGTIVINEVQKQCNSRTITIDLNVIDNQNSKVGFLAWEGDSILATEEFRINGDLLFNAQNPYNNVFNSTNSITGSTTLYNMDLDIYNIQNNIQDRKSTRLNSSH